MTRSRSRLALIAGSSPSARRLSRTPISSAGRPIRSSVRASASSGPGSRGLAAVSGHFHFDLAEDSGLSRAVRGSALYVGLVRDPVARARSIFSFFTRGLGADPAELKRRLRVEPSDDINVVVERWMSAPYAWMGWRHDQCRFICGEPSAAAAIRTIEQRYLAVVPTKRVDVLARAIADALGADRPPRFHAKAQVEAAPEIDPAVEARLRAYHVEDQKLFDWVRANANPLLERIPDVLSERNSLGEYSV